MCTVQYLSSHIGNHNVIGITTKLLVDANSIEIWEAISKIDDGDFLPRDIVGNTNKCYKKSVLFHMEGIHIKWVMDTIEGVTDILIFPMGMQTILQIEINYKICNIAISFPKNISEDLLNEVELVIQQIKKKMGKIFSD